MGELTSFLKQNASKAENVEYVVSQRFTGADGTPEKWIIRPLTSTEDEALRKSASRRVQVPGKKNLYTTDLNSDEYSGSMAAACTVYPNLNNAELQDSYGVQSAEALLKEMLLPGEYLAYLAKIQEVNGFDKTVEELTEEVKNS